MSTLMALNTASGTIASVYHQDRTICKVSLDPGKYLILASVIIDIDVEGIVSAGIYVPYDKSTLFPSIPSKSTSKAGGGVVNWGIVTVNETSEIELRSYGYIDSSYNLKGSMAALRIK